MSNLKTDRSKVRRLPSRGRYDQKTIHSILDGGFLCHISFTTEDGPQIIPTAYGRKGSMLFLHGSSKSRMMKHLAEGHPMAVCVTHLDALVLARSAFHSSMNYRAAIIFGKGSILTKDEDKMEALEVITEQILPGRWSEARLPNQNELKATTVIALPIEEGSAKVRTGPPGDNAEDYKLDIWAGLLPLEQEYGSPEDDPKLRKNITRPASILKAKYKSL